MPREDREAESTEGVVEEVMPNALYRVRLADGRAVLAHLSSRARIVLVRVSPGDRVSLELSPFDLARGHITARWR